MSSIHSRIACATQLGIAIAREANEVEARLIARCWLERCECARQQPRLAIGKSLKFGLPLGSNAFCPADDGNGHPQCDEDDSQRSGAIWHPDNPLSLRVRHRAPGPL